MISFACFGVFVLPYKVGAVGADTSVSLLGVHLCLLKILHGTITCMAFERFFP